MIHKVNIPLKLVGLNNPIYQRLEVIDHMDYPYKYPFGETIDISKKWTTMVLSHKKDKNTYIDIGVNVKVKRIITKTKCEHTRKKFTCKKEYFICEVERTNLDFAKTKCSIKCAPYFHYIQDCYDFVKEIMKLVENDEAGPERESLDYVSI